MTQLIQLHWLQFAVALVVALLIAWWLFGRSTKPIERRSHRPDVLDEGVAPAQRNQALIDSPSAMPVDLPPELPVIPANTVDLMGGLGELAAVEEPVSGAIEASEVAEAESTSPSGDDLGKLKGVGPKLVAALHGMGVTRYAQIAGWSDADVTRVDAALPPAFQGRIVRDNWVEQARFLSEGDVAGYEGKFGKL